MAEIFKILEIDMTS